GTGDGDGNELAVGAILRGHREAVSRLLPGAQRLYRGTAVGQGVGPYPAVLVEAEAAVSARQRLRRHRLEDGLAAVDIRYGQRAARGQRSPILDYRARRRPRYLRRIVGTGDMNGNDTITGSLRKVTIVRSNGVMQSKGFSGSEEIKSLPAGVEI